MDDFAHYLSDPQEIIPFPSEKKILCITQGVLVSHPAIVGVPFAPGGFLPLFLGGGGGGEGENVCVK